MRCPMCGCLEDKVIDSRSVREDSGVRRRREQEENLWLRRISNWPTQGIF